MPVGENIKYVKKGKFIRSWGKCITNTAELLLEVWGLFVYFWGEVREGVDKMKDFFEMSRYTKEMESLNILISRLYQRYLGTAVETA